MKRGFNMVNLVKGGFLLSHSSIQAAKSGDLKHAGGRTSEARGSQRSHQKLGMCTIEPSNSWANHFEAKLQAS